jgi:hypothetical protein
VVTYPAATVTDYQAGTTLKYSQASGTTFPIGVTKVTVTATDVSGNVGTATFNVTVLNKTAPVVTPPANVTATATSAAGAVVTYPAATVTDYQAGTTLKYSQASGTTFPIGTTTVTVTATDVSGNVATATFTVTVAVNQGIVLLQANGTTASLSAGDSLKLGANGSLFVNSSYSQALQISGKSSITARNILITGGYSSTGGSTLTPTPLTGQKALPDPLASLAAPSTTGMPVYSTSLICNTNSVLQPGVYLHPLVISGNSKVTFSPGTYVFDGGIDVIGSATLSGSGVTLYNSGGSMIFDNTGAITLTPPASGTYARVTLFQARGNTLPVEFIGGMPVSISGDLYFPSAQVEVLGGNLTFGLIDAQSMQLIGGVQQCVYP